MTSRRSERPAPGRLGKSTPSGKPSAAPGRATTVLGKGTPARGVRRLGPDAAPGKRAFEATWPLFGEHAPPSFPADPTHTVQKLAPPSSDLIALAERPEPPETTREIRREQKRMQAALPGGAPEWLRAAQALSAWLEQRVQSGNVEPIEQAAIARAWAAFCLGGVNESQILRVARLVQRAHTAIREAPRTNNDMQAVHAAAGVLHAGMPSAIRQRMPLERAIAVVWSLRDEADDWTAIVEGTTELLGWTDYARMHAASAIRAVLERSREP